MGSRRQKGSSVCLLLILGLLWPHPDSCASQSSSKELQQAWPTDGSIGSLRMLKGMASLGNAGKHSLQSLVAPAPEALHAPSQAHPQKEQEALPPGGSQGAAGQGAKFLQSPGQLQAPAHAGSPEAMLVRGVAWSPGRSGRAVHRRSLAQAPMFNVTEGVEFAPAPAPDLAAYLLIVMEVRILSSVHLSLEASLMHWHHLACFCRSMLAG